MTPAELATRKPQTRDQITAWIEYFLGFSVHQTVRCSHPPDGEEPHCSQLDYVAGAFLEEYAAAVVMASRNAGKSYGAALVNVLDGWFKPGIRIATTAFQRNQSDYIYTYMREFIQTMEAKLGKKGSVAKITKDAIEFVNGSICRFFTGKKGSAGVKGFHPHRLQVDEGDLFSLDQFEGIANGLEAAGEYAAIFTVLSTNYRGGDGVISKQIEKYRDWNKNLNPHLKPNRIFKICLLDVLALCDDRFKCSSCPLFTYCRGHAKGGSGFFKIESALSKMASTSRQNFEAEFLLMRPMSEYTYFHNFDSVKNIGEYEYRPELVTFIAYDFGGVHCPHAALVVQKDGDGVYWIVDEFTGMGNLENLIAKVKARYPNATDFECFYDPKGGDTLAVKNAVSFAGVLKREGFFPRSKNLKREPTFELMYNLIDPADGRARLIVNKRCKLLLKQIYAAECKSDRGRPTTEPADIKPDDLLDCLRYIIGWTTGSYAKWGGRTHLRWF